MEHPPLTLKQKAHVILWGILLLLMAPVIWACTTLATRLMKFSRRVERLDPRYLEIQKKVILGKILDFRSDAIHIPTKEEIYRIYLMGKEADPKDSDYLHRLVHNARDRVIADQFEFTIHQRGDL